MPTVRRPYLLLVLAGLGAAAGAGGCGDPGRSPCVGPSGTLPPAHAAGLAWPAGRWAWAWTAAGHGGADGGRAELLVTADAEAGRWAWRFPGAAPRPGDAVALVPADPAAWLPLTVPADAPAGSWLPLPRLPVASSAFAHLPALLAALTGPRFGARVVHWPGRPIPVRIPAARSGAVDLAACLRTAMARWNAGEAEPWFVAADTAAWGVRLVHLPGRRLTPPLRAQITRLDRDGRPLRIHLVVGDNYDDPWDSTYAARGLAHELGHALFLWGHSPDRAHVLWGAAPPLADGPSPDERKAARLWHGLPEGFDLSRRLGPEAPLTPP